MNIKLLHLYYDIMNLYGDYGNVVILKKHLEDQGANVILDKKSIGDEFSIDDYDFIYSMWAGYIERQNTWDMHMDKLVHIHTSGHASCEALKNFVEQINPGCIIPIHTECKHRFESMFGRPVLFFDNNETKEI